MNKHLQRILSLLCVLAMTFCAVSALAEDPAVQYDARVITVEWKDEDNFDQLRPDSLKAVLAGQEVILNEANDWTGEVLVPRGTDEAWTVEKPEGYALTQDAGDITLITLQHSVAAQKIDVSGTVVWEDGDNAGGIRPDAVQLILLADGEPYGEPLEARNPGWKVTWKDLPAALPGAENQIIYTVRQLQTPAGYTASASGLEVVNTLELGTLTLTAAVSGAPEGTDLSALTLTVDGPDPSMPQTLTWAQLSGGVHSFGSVLPGAYLVRGTNADTLVEDYVMDGAASRVSDAVMVRAGETASLTYRFTYKIPEAQEAEEDYDPLAGVGALSFEILGPDERMPLTLTYAQFTDGKYELDNLVPGVYTVVERNAETLVKYYTLTGASVTGMLLEVTPAGTATAKLFNQYTITPLPKGDGELLDIPVLKTWNDRDNADGNRPGSVTVRLYADGVETDSHALTAGENWTFTFTDKPRYQEDGITEIAYSVTEDAVPMYAATVAGFHIINDYQPEVTSVSVQKIWQDDNDAQKIRPASIAMTLSDGQKVVGIIVLSDENGWAATVNDLPTVVNGQPAQYAFREQSVIGYTLSDVKQDGSTMIFTNTIWKRPENPPQGKKPQTPGETWYVFEEYDTPLGVEVIINHVGDCFD